MGFYLPDTNQIRLRISYQAYEVILQDIAEFLNMPEKEQISSFLNRMLKYFWANANSTIAENRPKIYQKYLMWLKGVPDAEKLALSLSEQEMLASREQIRQLYASPPKAKGQNLKLIMTKSTREILERSQENILYQNNLTDYLAALIQEYASYPREKRERIFFDSVFQKLTRCIREQQEVEIIIQNVSYIVKPAQIETNGFLPYYYLIGYARPKEESLLQQDKLVSFRLQRIQSLTERDQFPFSFSAVQKAELKELQKTPAKITYLAGEEETITVRLTARGLYLYQHIILSGRPAFLERKNLPDSGAELTFCCTKEQIFQYFIRFGKEMEILAPVDLRNRFADLYQTAAGYYTERN